MKKSYLPLSEIALFHSFGHQMNGLFASYLKVRYALRGFPEWVLRFHRLFVFLIFAHQIKREEVFRYFK